MEVNNDAVTVSTSYGSRSKAYGGSTTVGNLFLVRIHGKDVCGGGAVVGVLLSDWDASAPSAKKRIFEAWSCAPGTCKNRKR